MNTSIKKTSRRGRMTYNEMRDALARTQADAYRYYRMCRIRRDKVMKALGAAVLSRNMLVAAVAMNVLLAMVVWILCTVEAK